MCKLSIRHAIVVILAAVLSCGDAGAQSTSLGPPVVAAPDQPSGAIALHIRRGSQVGASGAEQWIQNGSHTMLTNVTQPTLTPVLPARGTETGAAVIVAPGGGYMALAMEHEGWAVARWLSDHGVAAFVLKYRLLPASEIRNPERVRALFADFQAYPPAVEDAQAAIRLVRSRAEEWRVDPHRVGMMGFSAGAMTTLAVGTAAASNARPDFIAPIYPPMLAVTVPNDAPPMFVAIASDDALFGGKGYALIDSWQRAHRPVELHVYERGGHGFGVPADASTTASHLMDEFDWWMQSRGLLSAAPTH